ncbi:MAG: glycoside hydrolase family 3 protein [Clostridia bacterium]|nr:glycoside hydrolase family 3 protein [Clostridia bacterium]
MRKTAIGFLIIFLLFTCSFGSAWAEEESYVVIDEDDAMPPDSMFQARVMMRRMSDLEKICQLFIVEPEALTGEKRTTALPTENTFSQYPVGGIMLFGQNIESEEQLRLLTNQINSQAAAAKMYPLFIAVDEEGGLVSRVANKLGYELAASPEEIGKGGDEQKAYDAGKYISGYLNPLGINLTFAPTADTALEDLIDGMQFYGEDPALVSRMAAAMAKGLREGGVAPCYTHFPGRGSFEGVTLKKLSIKRSVEEMRASEWIPFRDAIADDIEMIMVSHGYMRLIEEEIPASTSNRVVNGLLRGELGYQGVVVTDSLRMNVIASNYKTGQECVAALKAGADLLLLPPDLSKAVRAIQTAVSQGELTMERIEESVLRVLALKIRLSASGFEKAAE